MILNVGDFILYEGDIEPLLIGAGLLIVVYVMIDFLARKIKQKTTYHADILAPIAAFMLSIIGTILISSIQEWALLLPLIMLITIIPTSLLLTFIKTIVIRNRKKTQ